MKTLTSALLLFLLFTSACNNADPEPDPKKIDLSLKSKQLVEADNSFGLEVFQRLNETEKGNFNISPLSISQALAMTYNGARGETKAAMEEALKKAGFTTDEINQSYQSLVKALLGADSKVTLEIAQSIWYRKGFNVLQDFKTVNQTYYDAEVKELDFSRSDALKTINGWIEDKTHDKIKDMIKEIDPDHVMFLINAVYYYAEWQTKFDKKNTSKQDFTKEDGSIVKVDMMSKTDSVNYLSNKLFTAVQLPYGRGNFNMVVMVPNETYECNDLVDQLTSENWNKWMQSFHMTNSLNIELPKFKAEYEVKLNDVLSAMGMEIAFTKLADFTGINSKGEIYIDYVQHNTFIEVDENGTEAAAATVVSMKDYAAMPIFFKANKPFLFAITEKETGVILFIGKIKNPN